MEYSDGIGYADMVVYKFLLGVDELVSAVFESVDCSAISIFGFGSLRVQLVIFSFLL